MGMINYSVLISKKQKYYLHFRYVLCLRSEIQLVLLCFYVRQHAAAGARARGNMGFTKCTENRWGGSCCGGLLGLLQLLPVDLSLFRPSILKPDLHLINANRRKLYCTLLWENITYISQEMQHDSMSCLALFAMFSHLQFL